MSAFNVIKGAAAALFALASLTFPAAIAEAVTPGELIHDVGEMGSVDSVTTGAAVRARADVQIRRIKTLIITKSSDDDANFDRLEKLQKELRGER